MPQLYQCADELADAVIRSVGNIIVMGVPIGIGKAAHVVDALFARALADPDLSLTIFTGLTLEKPVAGSDLERRFLEPLAERLFGDWPTPAYATAQNAGRLPDNIEVHEFYLRPGAYLGNPLVQQSYASISYSHVVTELMRLGVNVIAQLVAKDASRPETFSLGSNPEITLDLLPELERQRNEGRRVAIVGQVNDELPFMTGDAELPADRFDFVLDAPDCQFSLFGLPNRRVSGADYATAMHVASLVPDGGTLQIGIGSLSDAVAHCLELRHNNPDLFRDVLERLPGGTATERRNALPVHVEPFNEGLFASTELLSDALFALFEAGLVKRPADDADPAVIHAGFFVGSSALYEKLRNLPAESKSRINMTSISNVNTLFGDEQRKRQQRRLASFVNETMMVTLLGAAVSDGLDDGRVVSGVGGQFDFVAMAHALADAQSILMCRARRLHQGKARSNIRWSYGHVTVPRHHRDVYVTEYGIAATRGLSDRAVIEAMINVADSAFQDELVDAAKKAGKLPAGYIIPADARDNLPASIDRVFKSPDVQPHFPAFPLGTQLTPTEQHLAAALGWLQNLAARPLANISGLAAAAVRGGDGDHGDALARMGLEQASGFKQRMLTRLLRHALDRTSL